ncbi:hypothetical protein EVAR_102507_1 [Eumeta japonica]|uniref:Uncharacterized protein n=1 Tax=Eumeta variegata TaxID=151549 RepID=A0A4C1ZW08_EUMVA|nr:hypothetical protein EVAR_102507_1 [Eumeta japonica]
MRDGTEGAGGARGGGCDRGVRQGDTYVLKDRKGAGQMRQDTLRRKETTLTRLSSRAKAPPDNYRTMTKVTFSVLSACQSLTLGYEAFVGLVEPFVALFFVVSSPWPPTERQSVKCTIRISKEGDIMSDAASAVGLCTATKSFVVIKAGNSSRERDRDRNPKDDFGIGVGHGTRNQYKTDIGVSGRRERPATRSRGPGRRRRNDVARRGVGRPLASRSFYVPPRRRSKDGDFCSPCVGR